MTHRLGIATELLVWFGGWASALAALENIWRYESHWGVFGVLGYLGEIEPWKKEKWQHQVDQVGLKEPAHETLQNTSDGEQLTPFQSFPSRRPSSAKGPSAGKLPHSPRRRRAKLGLADDPTGADPGAALWSPKVMCDKQTDQPFLTIIPYESLHRAFTLRSTPHANHICRPSSLTSWKLCSSRLLLGQRCHVASVWRKEVTWSSPSRFFSIEGRLRTWKTCIVQTHRKAMWQMPPPFQRCPCFRESDGPYPNGMLQNGLNQCESSIFTPKLIELGHFVPLDLLSHLIWSKLWVHVGSMLSQSQLTTW